MSALNRLTDTQIKNAIPGKHNDGGGLWFIKRMDGGSQWIYRFSLHGKRPEMGLGSYPNVKLVDVRKQAARWRAVLSEGKNPIKERQRIQKQCAIAVPTFEVMTVETLEAIKRQLVGDGKAGRWDSPLRLHVMLALGSTPIEEIDQRDIQRALAPIWHEKAETARKALNRIGLVFKHAAAAGLDVDLQATAKAKALLGAQEAKVKHVPSLDWREVPVFYESINEGTPTHLALRLLILTGVRSKSLRFCNVAEIADDVWTIPAENMKALRGKATDFRVPLSRQALTVIDEAKKFERNGFLFPNKNKGVISDATMSRYMERKGMEARPHGFRSSFRTWCAEATDTPREVAETALAHVAGGKVERAYRRTDFLEQRHILMERWAGHVTGRGGELVRLHG